MFKHKYKIFNADNTKKKPVIPSDVYSETDEQRKKVLHWRVGDERAGQKRNLTEKRRKVRGRKVDYAYRK